MTDPSRSFDELRNLVYDTALLAAAWDPVRGNGGKDCGMSWLFRLQDRTVPALPPLGGDTPDDIVRERRPKHRRDTDRKRVSYVLG